MALFQECLTPSDAVEDEQTRFWCVRWAIAESQACLLDDGISIHHVLEDRRGELLPMLGDKSLLLRPELLHHLWVILQVAETLSERCGAGVVSRQQQQQDVVVDLAVCQPAAETGRQIQGNSMREV